MSNLTAANLTAADLDRMEADDRWFGAGFLRGRRVALSDSDPEVPAQPERVAEVDAWIVAEAVRLELDYEAVFEWANSRNGRWFADVVFGGGSIEEADGWGLGPR